MYIILTCDLIQSKKVVKRSKVQEEIKNALNYVNTHFSNNLLCPFVSVWGDSFQGALKSLGGFFEIIETFEEQISVNFRCGIGIGKIATKFSTNVMEMDGPAFYRSKSALEIAEKKNRRILVKSGNIQYDTMVNTVFILLYVLKTRWTAHQKEIIHHRRKGLKYEEIGKMKGISKQAIGKTLKAAHWVEASFAIDTLNGMKITYFKRLED
ncbi:MAG: SatD family protein [Candidatus Hodarchaeales archaeon]|jgi:hypothetical protein